MSTELRIWSRIEEMFTVFVCVLCATAGTFYLAPALLYLSNAKEVVVPLSEVIALSAIPQAVLVVAAVAGSWLCGPGARLRVATFCAGIALLVSLQGTFFVWDYGRFDGSEIDWDRHRLVGWIELAVWLGVLISSQIFSTQWNRVASRVALLAVAIQIASVGIEVSAGRNLEHAVATASDRGLASFSKEQNVLILVLDGFQSHYFDAIVRQSPEISESLRGFVYFHDTLSVFPTTMMSIPAMISGRVYDNATPAQEFLAQSLSRDSLPEALATKGFASSIVSEAAYCEHFVRSSCTGLMEIADLDDDVRRRRDAFTIWNVTLFRHVPHFLKRLVYRNHQWILNTNAIAIEHTGSLHAPTDDPSKVQAVRQQQSSGLLWSIFERDSDADNEQKTFKLLHFWSSHPPFVLDPKCELLDRLHFDLTHEQQRNLNQSRCALTEALELVDHLEQLGVLDQTLVVIVADHGSPSPLVSMPGLEGIEIDRAFPLLLIKPIGSGAPFRTTKHPASLADLPRTLAQLLAVDHVYPGHNLFGEANPRERKYSHYRWQHGFWRAEYLPALREYVIDGSGRDASAWRTGRLLRPGG